MSPNYPKVYEKNQTCEWQITTDASHRLKITLNDFDIEQSDNCENDVLFIFDGPVEDENRIILKLCGNTLPNQTVYYSTANEMLVVFKANTDLEFKGFKASFETDCGSRIVTNGTGLITLTEATRLYSSNCTWTIIAADPTKHVTLTISHLTMIFHPDDANACAFYVEITEGETNAGPLRAKKCKNEASTDIVSNGNALTVHLGSNPVYSSVIIGLSFMAHYSVLDNGKFHFVIPTFSSKYLQGYWG